MTNKISILIFVLVIVFFTYIGFVKSQELKRDTEEVIFDDGYRTKSEGEVVFDDSILQDFNQVNPVTIEGMNEQTKILGDSSKLTIMYDRYGNRIENRSFGYHPRLTFIILQTSASGQKQVFVYGKNGEVKSLPETMLNKIFTASADEIANAAGIYQVKREATTFNPVSPLPVQQTTLKPLPSSEFTVQNQPSEPVPAGEPQSESAGQIPIAEKRETISSDRKPEDEQ